jgi:hypothetical protein
MWDAYLTMSADHPFAAAFVQFLVLGTLGEALSGMVRTGVRRWPMSPARTALKAIGWGLLGAYIKGMFLTAATGVASLAEHGALPAAAARPDGLGEVVLAAAAASTLMNVMLGPSMMILHRLADNGIDRLLGAAPIGWAGLDRGMATLIWLWIPLHTFTFTQAREVRVGIAAVLSLVLGVVMGWTARTAKPRTP